MNNEDKIKDLFAEKLGQLETPVNPNLWSGIASQIGAVSATSVSSAGMSILSKVLIGVAAAGVIGVGAYFITKEKAIDVKSSNATDIVEPALEKLPDADVNNENDLEGLNPETAISPSKKQAITVLKENHKVNKDQEQQIALPTLIAPIGVAEQKSHAYKNDQQGDSKSNVITSVNKSDEVTKPSKTVVESPSANTVVPQVEEVKATFELTKTPNIYVLNASGYFSISHKGEYQDFQFTLMDSKNKVIFRANDPNFEWRGVDLSGTLIEPGNYIYIITAVDKNGKAINKYSPLTVINQ